jgi:hypothetical protein
MMHHSDALQWFVVYRISSNRGAAFRFIILLLFGLADLLNKHCSLLFERHLSCCSVTTSTTSSTVIFRVELTVDTYRLFDYPFFFIIHGYGLDDQGVGVRVLVG